MCEGIKASDTHRNSFTSIRSGIDCRPKYTTINAASSSNSFPFFLYTLHMYISYI